MAFAQMKDLEGLRIEFDGKLKDLNDRAVISIDESERKQVAQAAEIGRLVDEAANAKFDEANASFKAEQERVAVQFATKQEELNTVVSAIETKVASVEGGKLDQVATLLGQYKKEQDDNVRVIHQIMSAEVRSMHEQFHNHIQQTNYRLAQIEAVNQHSSRIPAANPRSEELGHDRAKRWTGRIQSMEEDVRAPSSRHLGRPRQSVGGYARKGRGNC